MINDIPENYEWVLCKYIIQGKPFFRFNMWPAEKTPSNETIAEAETANEMAEKIKKLILKISKKAK